MQRIIAVDEVGRGPGAGPVLCVAVAMDFPKPWRKHFQLWEDALGQLGVKDSKKLSESKRQSICQVLDIPQVDKLQLQTIYQASYLQGFSYALSSRTHLEIDQGNILKCTLECMDEVIQLLASSQWSNTVLIDGNIVPPLALQTYRCYPIIKGDTLCKSIALASIIAKTTRDAWMSAYHLDFPQYCFDKNKGYLTAEHRNAIKKFGVSAIHRLSFTLRS